jgi:hypothetical protein
MNIEDTKLCTRLRDHSGGDYRPSARAADRIEALNRQNEGLLLALQTIWSRAMCLRQLGENVTATARQEVLHATEVVAKLAIDASDLKALLNEPTTEKAGGLSMRGSTEYRQRFDGAEGAYNGEMHDALSYVEGKWRYCGDCRRRVGLNPNADK